MLHLLHMTGVGELTLALFSTFFSTFLSANVMFTTHKMYCALYPAASSSKCLPWSVLAQRLAAASSK